MKIYSITLFLFITCVLACSSAPPTTSGTAPAPISVTTKRPAVSGKAKGLVSYRTTLPTYDTQIELLGANNVSMGKVVAHYVSPGFATYAVEWKGHHSLIKINQSAGVLSVSDDGAADVVSPKKGSLFALIKKINPAGAAASKERFWF